MLVEKYKKAAATPSDIYKHIPILYKYASECKHITEFGTRKVVSSWAFAYSKPEKIILYDINHDENIDVFLKVCNDNRIVAEFKKEDTKQAVIENTDLLFIDTLHTYEQVKAELRNHTMVKKYIILHDTSTFGEIGHGGSRGIKFAILEFLKDNDNWLIEYETDDNNGLMILRNTSYTTPRDKNLLLGIPVLGNSNLLYNTITSLIDNVTKYNLEFFFINNTENIDDRKKLYDVFDKVNCSVFDLKNNIGVSRSWNRIIFNALQKDKTPYILSSDLIFKSNMDDVLNYTELYTDRVNLIKSYNFFTVSKNIINEVGWFDEHIFPAYKEDCDYSHRIKSTIGSYFIKNVPISKEITHLGSQTLRNENSDIEMTNFIKKQSKIIAKYYIIKWGGLPGKEIYTTPFNI
jgi:hypothetical protein